MSRGLSISPGKISSHIQIFLIFLIFLFPLLSLPQNDIIPDIEKKINKADSLAYAENFSEATAELAIVIAEIEDADDPAFLATFYNKMGHYLSMAGQDQKSIPYFHKSIYFAQKINDSIILGDVLNNMGIAIGYTGHPDSAFFYYEKALKIREQLADTTRLAATYRNMAEVLRVLRRMEEAKVYCRKAFKLIPGINDFKIITNIYNETGYLYELNMQLDTAKYFYNQLIEISKMHNFKRGLAVGYSNLASVYELEQNLHAALELKLKGLMLDKEIENVYGIMTSYRTISTCYLQMKNYSAALIYLDSASYLCDSSWIADLMGIENSKYLAYKGLGNYSKSLTHYEKSIELKDSVFNERKRKNIAEILTRYETEKKEQQIEILHQTNELQTKRNRIQLLLLVVGALVSISGAAISFLVIKNKNQRIHQMNLELRNYLFQIRNSEKNESSGKEDTLLRLKSNFGLTQREAEILELIAQGFTNAKLGEKLFISENTIKYHIKNIYIKLDVNNRVQALQKAHIEEVMEGIYQS